MPNSEKKSARVQALPRHPYPLLRVPSTAKFLDSLELQISQSPTWHQITNRADFRAVVTNYGGDGFNGKELGISAYDLDFDEPRSSNIVCFAVVAREWFRDGKEILIVSDADIKCAFKLFLPIVQAACGNIGIGCRISYPKPQKKRPLAPKVTQKLSSFVQLANLRILHPYDWERFYQLVRYCHQHGVHLGEADLRDEMIKQGVPSELAKKLALLYAHGRGILSGRYEWVA